MDVIVIGMIATLTGEIGTFSVILLRRDTASQQQLAGSQAYKNLVDGLGSLNQQNESLRKRLSQKEAYIAYLVNGIRERCEWKPGSFWEWVSQNSSDDRLNNLKPLADALIGAFDAASFDRMLRQFGKSREEITTANGLRNVVWDVLEAAERENWLGELKRSALAANPTNQRLLKVQ